MNHCSPMIVEHAFEHVLPGIHRYIVQVYPCATKAPEK